MGCIFSQRNVFEGSLQLISNHDVNREIKYINVEEISYLAFTYFYYLCNSHSPNNKKGPPPTKSQNKGGGPQEFILFMA
jgi:hypothetical protein